MRKYLEKEEYKLIEKEIGLFKCEVSCAKPAIYGTGEVVFDEYNYLCQKHYNDHFNATSECYYDSTDYIRNYFKNEEEKTMKKFNINDYTKNDFAKVQNVFNIYCLNCKGLIPIYKDTYFYGDENQFIVKICTTCYETLKSEPFRIIKGETTVQELQDNYEELGFERIKVIGFDFEGTIYNKALVSASQVYHELLLSKKVLKFMTQGKLLVCIVED